MKSTVKAYAKVNLFLDITGRLENGYHTLNTVMQQIDLYDIVTVEVNDSGEISIACDNPAVPCSEKNIAYKACRLFSEISEKNIGAKINIQKNIPLEAGMGGSSTDGAAVLTALNEIYGSPFTTAQLCEMGAKLGADVPFCILGGTAVCTGIGDIMKPVTCMNDYILAVIKPDFSCSTPLAYKTYDENPVPKNTDFEDFVSALPYGHEKWSGKMYNVFEKLYNSSEIREVTSALIKNGAADAILTGSGSAVFGLFKNKEEAKIALNNINAPFKIIANPVSSVN